MPRVRELTLDSLKVKIAAFSWDEAEAYLKESKEMLERSPKPEPEEWIMRTLITVARSMNKADGKTNGDGWDPQKLRSEFDIVTIEQIYNEITKMSGLIPDAKGEAPATSTSR